MSNRVAATDTKKAKLKPNLRFPEFEDKGEWDEIKLIDVTDRKVKWSFIGGPFGSNLKSSDYTAHGVRIIQLQNIGDAEFLNDYKIFTTEKKANDLLSCNIYPGDIILSKMGDPVGRACLIPNNHVRYLMCSDGIRLVVNEQMFSKYFIFSLINSNLFRNLVEETATGSTRKRIGLDDLRNLPMVVPGRTEQQKIADCLSSLDDRIAAETRKLDTLKAHKRGLMQQLFPAEGENAPERRFPEFRSTEKWKYKVVKEVFTIFQGYAFSSKDSVDTGTRWVKIADVGIRKMESSSLSYLPSNFAEEHRKFLIEEGDYIIALTRPILNKQLKIARVNSLCDGALLNQRVGKLLTTQNIDFIYFLMQTEYLTNEIEKNISGSEPPNLSVQKIEDVGVYIPSELEQRKIAKCLSSIDDFIAVQSCSIDTLKAHKKGLMQQLFPSFEEAKI